MKTKRLIGTIHCEATVVAGLICAASFGLFVSPISAAVPPDPAVQLNFSEGTGSTTLNTGYLAGSATLDPGTTTTGTPAFTNNVPTGTYTPSGNTSALNMGTLEASINGGRKVDLLTDNGPLNTVGGFPYGITVCGWVNCRDLNVGSGGNRIAFALEGPGGLGFDVMQRGGGTLGFNANQYNDGGPTSSPGTITADTNAAPGNWVFFAVTYDHTLPSEQVKFYFGGPEKLAALDSVVNYTPPTRPIDFTGKLTVGNFSDVEAAYSGTNTASRTYRGLIDQLRVYTNIFTIDQIQQAQIENANVPQVPVTILRHPANTTVKPGPLRTAKFYVEATGSGALTYTWYTNNVVVQGVTGRILTLPAETTAYDGTKVKVAVDNAYTADPGVMSDEATLSIPTIPPPDLLLRTTADVLYNSTQVFNSWAQDSQVAWGLGGSGGVTTSAGRRSFMQFSLGTQRAASATLRMWNYWGGPPVNGTGRLPQANTRIYGALPTAPKTFVEAPDESHGTVEGFTPFPNSDFTAIAPDQLVGPDIGWYDFNITDWYNNCLGQTTTIMLRASATSGMDFPLYEDREGTAFLNNSGGSAADTGPRIEVMFAPATPPKFDSVSISSGNVSLGGSGGAPNGSYILLSSDVVNAAAGSWTRVSTNNFDATGNFTTTVPVSSSSGQTFYRLLLP